MTSLPPTPDGYKGKFYGCLRCKGEVKFSRVERMGNVGKETFQMSHTCLCTPGHVFERVFWTDHMALKRLLGGLRPVLPYSAAPGRSLPLATDQERQVRVFRWECEQLDSVHELLLLASRPESR